jgi:hypothetical protein
MSSEKALSRFHQPIAVPGRRLMHSIPLSFVKKKVIGGGGRATNHEVPLIPFIDFLLCIVCFLLASFSASGELPIDKKQVPIGDRGDYSYPELAKKISEEWNSNGSHRAPSDLKLDQAVLHSDNSTPFSDITAVIDAIYAPKRDVTLGGKTAKMPSFNVTFAVN